MIENLVTAGLCWIALGATVWALNDPALFLDFVVQSYVQRHGRLPSMGMIVLCHGVAIVLWPKAVGALIEGMRG